MEHIASRRCYSARLGFDSSACASIQRVCTLPCVRRPYGVHLGHSLVFRAPEVCQDSGRRANVRHIIQTTHEIACAGCAPAASDSQGGSVIVSGRQWLSLKSRRQTTSTTWRNQWERCDILTKTGSCGTCSCRRGGLRRHPCQHFEQVGVHRNVPAVCALVGLLPQHLRANRAWAHRSSGMWKVLRDMKRSSR